MKPDPTIHPARPAFAERLRTARLARGKSMEDFALSLGKSRIAQYNYETAQRAPDVDYLLTARDQGLDVAALLNGEAQLPVSTMAAIVQAICELAEAQAQTLNPDRFAEVCSNAGHLILQEPVATRPTRRDEVRQFVTRALTPTLQPTRRRTIRRSEPA